MHARSFSRAALLTLTGLACLAGAASAQFSIARYTVDCGGGVHTGGAFVLSGTSGQPDAGRLSGGSFTLTGGFWSGGSGGVSGVQAGEPDSAAALPGSAPLAFRVHSAAPNPVTDEAVIAFDLPEPATVMASVYDAGGRLVRTLWDESLPAGRHQRIWNRRDQEGNRIPAGIYFLTFEAGTHRARQKVVIVH